MFKIFKKKPQPIYKTDFDKLNLQFAQRNNLKYNLVNDLQRATDVIEFEKIDRFNCFGNFPLEYLKDYKKTSVSKPWINDCYQTINQTLNKYEINARVVSHSIGASTVRFDLSLGDKTTIKKVANIKSELKHYLKCETLTIDNDKMGIVIPIETKSVVGLKSLLKEWKYQFNKSKLKVVLGVDLENNPIIIDLTTLPHLLIAGATGGGKSVCVNVILTNLLYNYTPCHLRLILADLKQVELTPYNNLQHLLKPIITSTNECITALEYLQNEITNRQQLFTDSGNKNIETYNENNEKIPYIIFLIDEFSKLIMNEKEAEGLIQDIAERGRAFGIHLIMTTQTPNKDTITKTIKNNLLGRIAFKVADRFVSEMIIEQPGAETLLGNGDMFFKHNTSTRLQGCYISEEEIESITNHFRTGPVEQPTRKVNQDYIDAGLFFINQGHGSVSSLRTIIKKYDNADKLTKELIANGVIDGEKNGNKGYKVLMSLDEFDNHWRGLYG